MGMGTRAMIGIWWAILLQVAFADDGARTVRLLVSDGTETTNFDIVIKSSPQPMGVLIASAGVLIVALLGAATIFRRRGPHLGRYDRPTTKAQSVEETHVTQRSKTDLERGGE